MNETSPAYSTARKWATFALCGLVIMVPALDLTALNQAVPHLTADLGPSATQILWIADAYGFALAGLLITMGGIGDRIGHKRLLLIGAGLFGITSALTAYAWTAEVLIAARFLLGIAGATLMPSALSLIRRVFTEPKERTMAVGIFSGIGGLAVGLGPVLGGALLDHFWWGSVFLINVPIMMVILVAGFAVLPAGRGTRPGRLDLLSVPLSIAGLIGLVYAIKEVAASGAVHADALVAAAIGAASLAAFGLRQVRIDDPLIDVRLFRRMAFSGSVATNMFAMFALVAQSLIFSLYFQLVLGWSPLQSGLAGLPGALGAMVGGAALAPPLIGLVGRARVVAAGLALGAVAYALLAQVGTDTGYLVMVGPIVLSGIGMGMVMTVTADTVLATVPRERTGAASAISETGMELGGSLGMAILGSVLNAVYRDSVQVPAGLPAAAEHAARDSVSGAAQVAAELPGRLAAEVTGAAGEAFADGMNAALLCSSVLAAVVGVFALIALRNVPKVIPDTSEDAAVPAAETVPAAAG
ncbi:MFS transporter [Actinomadura sp. 9N407]|uniref:MFS transporter n=1 Tax=Actinomadura sp. 9N407 TaxID=3375154 RepID=UPI0037A30CBF